MGFDYKVIYKHNKNNIIADILYRRDEEIAECQSLVVSWPQFAFVDRLRVELLEDPVLAPLLCTFRLFWTLPALFIARCSPLVKGEVNSISFK